MLKSDKKSYFQLFTLCLPAVIILFLFNYVPMGGILLAFKDYKPLQGIWGSPWAGLDNFLFFIRSSLIWEVTRNTLLYNIAFLILTPVISVTIAILLYEIGTRLSIRVYQTAYFLPYFLSWVVVAIMAYTFLNSQFGFLNQTLQKIGLSRVSWYTQPQYWPFILIIVGVWKRFGYMTIIYYAGLVSMDPELFEAADIDGASRWQKNIYITVPMLLPIIAVLTILGIGRIFYADFGLHFQVPMQSGPLLPAVDVINYYTYRALFELRDYGMGAAIGLYQSIMGLILVIGSNAFARKISAGENALF